MNGHVTEPSSDVEIIKAKVEREIDSQQLLHRDKMRIWRYAVADCLALARSYTEMAEIAASVEDDVVLRHGVANFLAAAREAQSIYRDFRPKAPWETPSAKNEAPLPQTAHGGDRKPSRQVGDTREATIEPAEVR